jgi:threonine dehydrogenase-like Zn-dependent dehydrogenase
VCRYCIDGRETLCERQQNSGYSVDGAFAEYAVADATYVVPVPDGISSLDAAPLSCAALTTYKALKVAGVQPADQVGIFGIGGLGHLAVQYARLMGAVVTAIDIEAPKLDLALELGADHTVDAAATDPVSAIAELGGLDVALVLAASPVVFEQAFASLRRGGRLVCVAMPADAATMNLSHLRHRHQGHHGRRVDRGHPRGPRRGVRPARRWADPRHRRDPPPRGRQRRDRRGPLREDRGPPGFRLLHTGTDERRDRTGRARAERIPITSAGGALPSPRTRRVVP